VTVWQWSRRRPGRRWRLVREEVRWGIVQRLWRRFTGIDLSAEYLAMAERRIRNPEPEAFAVVPEAQMALGLDP